MKMVCKPVPRFAGLLVLLGLTLSLTGCLGNHARKRVDRETYPLVLEAQRRVLGRDRSFTIENTSDTLTREILAMAGPAADEFSTSGLRISLGDTLGLAVANSREYQSQKEGLYGAAISLGEAQYQFSPMFSSVISGEFSRTATTSFDGGVGDPGRSASLSIPLGVSWLFATGTRVTMNFATNLTQFISPSAESATGLFSASIVQPLLRDNPFLGGGTIENLRQSERNLIYQVRSFSRFEKNFLIDRIEEYFRILQQLDSIKNQSLSLEGLSWSRQQSEALSEAGKLALFQVQQAQTSELSALNSLVQVKTRFMQALDSFRINLGLPIGVDIMPNENELQVLIDEGLEPIDITLAEATQLALDRRYEVMTARQRIEDAERRIKIAENSLLPQVDIFAQGSVRDDNENQPFDMDLRRRSYSVGFDAEIPFERKFERNSYRQALINRDALQRDYDELRDRVVQEIRAIYSDLQAARVTYDIQKRSVEIANARVENTQIQLQAGRVQVRDVLEADTAQLNARNQLTQALIDYTITRLRFLVAIEGLQVDDQGAWREGTDIATDTESE